MPNNPKNIDSVVIERTYTSGIPTGDEQKYIRSPSAAYMCTLPSGEDVTLPYTQMASSYPESSRCSVLAGCSATTERPARSTVDNVGVKCPLSTRLGHDPQRTPRCAPRSAEWLVLHAAEHLPDGADPMKRSLAPRGGLGRGPARAGSAAARAARASSKRSRPADRPGAGRGHAEFGMVFTNLSIGYASREGSRAGSALAIGDASLCPGATIDPGAWTPPWSLPSSAS